VRKLYHAKTHRRLHYHYRHYPVNLFYAVLDVARVAGGGAHRWRMFHPAQENMLTIYGGGYVEDLLCQSAADIARATQKAF